MHGERQPESGPELEHGEASIHPPAGERLLPWLAALSAADLRYRVVEETGGWVIRVPVEQAAQAKAELAEYERVNKDWPPPPLTRAGERSQPPTAGTLLGSTAVVCALLAFYRVSGPFEPNSSLHAKGCADSAAIIQGAWWRAVTALTLHADLPHVLGNAVCCFLFGIEVSRQVGGGIAWALILATGVAGNLAAAYTAGPGRAAIGASTATFGALGLLSSFQFCRNYWRTGRIRGIWNRTWIPLGAGVALLALLGVRQSPTVDIAAHLFGFVAGLAAGVLAAPLLKRRSSEWIQLLAIGAAAAVIHTAWALALRR